mmetsp:Transcript_145661/g.369646  ORF Transcript_145661/g.369646 Transcript_145661/m.369646 type:complete len:731 (-) Transcript_145661:35-2227(-)
MPSESPHPRAEQFKRTVAKIAGTIQSTICLRCLEGPPPEARTPLGLEPPPPLCPKLSDWLLCPWDWLLRRAAQAMGPRLRSCCGTGSVRRQSCSPGTQYGLASCAGAAAQNLEVEIGVVGTPGASASGSPGATGPDGPTPQQDSADVELTVAMLRHWLQIICVVLFSALLCICYHYQVYAASTEAGSPLPLTCHSHLNKYDTRKFGESQCGLGAADCQPTSSWRSVRCNGWCAQDQGDDIFGRKVVGSGPYRADSKLCMAGVHAGLIDNQGGCFDVRVGGTSSGFVGGDRNGITAVNFSSWFPVSLELRPSPGALHCGYDGWWALLALNVSLLFFLSLLRLPKQAMFWCMLTALYWYCAVAAFMSHVQTTTVVERSGEFMVFALVSHLMLWEVGGGKLYFPDTARGAPIDLLVLELLPSLPFLHINLMGKFFGDYDLNRAILQSWRGPLIYIVGAALLAPLAIVVLRRWYRSGKMRSCVCSSCKACAALLLITILITPAGCNLHLHHYFVGLMGWLAARGNSRAAMVARALSLGAIINGICLFGILPMWDVGHGWYPTNAVIDSGSAGTSVQWTGVEAGRVDANGTATELHLSWALVRGLDTNGCSGGPRSDLVANDLNSSVLDANDWNPWAQAPAASPRFVLEMNHVEVYRGASTSFTVPLPPSDSGRYFFRVGRLRAGWSGGVDDASLVLPVRSAEPLFDFPYNATADVCERMRMLQARPVSSLSGYI